MNKLAFVVGMYAAIACIVFIEVRHRLKETDKSNKNEEQESE